MQKAMAIKINNSYLTVTGSSFISTQIGQIDDTIEDLNSCTPSVFRTRVILFPAMERCIS